MLVCACCCGVCCIMVWGVSGTEAWVSRKPMATAVMMARVWMLRHTSTVWEVVAAWGGRSRWEWWSGWRSSRGAGHVTVRGDRSCATVPPLCTGMRSREATAAPKRGAAPGVSGGNWVARANGVRLRVPVRLVRHCLMLVDNMTVKPCAAAVRCLWWTRCAMRVPQAPGALMACVCGVQRRIPATGSPGWSGMDTACAPERGECPTSYSPPAQE